MSAETGIMTNVIDYPVKTSEWGKTLIDTLNPIIDRLEKLILTETERVTQNVNLQFKTLREDVNKQVDEISGTASAALTLAQQNEMNIQSMNTKIERLERTCTNLTAENKTIYGKNEQLEFTCDQLNNENKELQLQNNNLENYSRRSNIVIRGIAEPQQETNADCELTVKNFFKVQLKLPDDVVNAMQIERCHRFGIRGPTKRPIIVRFCNYKDKVTVWDAKFKNTDHGYYISDNFSRNTEFKRRKLYAVHKKAKSLDQYKKKSSLNGDVLTIDSVRYSVDNLNMLPKELNPRQFSEKSNNTHLVFGGIHSDYQPLSNWYLSELRYKGHTFHSVEQAYQWEKATQANDVRVAKKLLYTTSPRVAKSLGRSVKGLAASKWDENKKNVMRELVKIKFSENLDLSKELLNSKDLTLVEAGMDLFYGVGLSITNADIFDSTKWKGRNHLGDILCSVRKDLKDKQ